MPTVIDSLVVELGLDPSKLTKGQQQALESFKKANESYIRGAKEIEKVTKDAGLSLSDLRNQALGIFTAFSGGRGVIEFAGNIIRSDAAVGRLSRNLGISRQEIAAWQSIATVFGGSGAEMAQTFTAINDAVKGFEIGKVSPMIQDFRALSTAGGTLIDVNKGTTSVLLAIAANLKAISETDPGRAGLLGRMLGLDSGTYDLFITRSIPQIKELLEKMVSLNKVTKDNGDAFDELEKRIANMGNRAKGIARKAIGGEAGATMWMRLADELGKDNFLDAKPWDAIFGIGTYANKPAPSSDGAFKNAAEKEAFIRSEAERRGINPDIAVAVAKSEGFNNYSGDLDATGKPTSFGAFQLHYPGVGRNTADGLGTLFTKQTGLDARDPRTEREQIRFALDQAKAGGWRPWHGWPGSAFAGISPGGNSSTVNNNITVNVPAGSDGHQIGSAVVDHLRRQSDAANANGGAN
jgi:hypothetical protein